MADTEQSKPEQAVAATEEKIITMLHDPSPQDARARLGKRNLDENDTLVLVTR